MTEEHSFARPQGNRYQGSVWDLVRAYGPDVHELCHAGPALLAGIGGLSLAAGPAGKTPRVRFASDDASSHVETLQHTLNEGPCRDAESTCRPVHAADLSGATWHRRWPRFTPGALATGVRAVIAVPLHAGGVHHQGAIDVCRQTPGEWDNNEQTAVATFTAAVTELLTLERLNLDLAAAFTDARLGASILDLANGAPVGTLGLLEGPPRAGSLARWFDRLSLGMTRRQVHTVSAGYGLLGDRAYRFTLAVHEAMVNAVRHGGGHGQLLLWRRAGRLCCEVSDHGPGIDAPQMVIRQPGTATDTGMWDDLLRVAASVKGGHATAALVVGKLCSSKRQQNALTSAIKEYGALRRTLYATRYLADETYRRRISRQLNKGENLHALRRALAYAAEGALRRRHHEQQSEQMWCLTLATNAIVCWSTEYHGLGVAALGRTGREVDDEVLAHIWPTHHENVHFYGTHSVDIDGELAQLDADGYRPLRPAALPSLD